MHRDSRHVHMYITHTLNMSRPRLSRIKGRRRLVAMPASTGKKPNTRAFDDVRLASFDSDSFVIGLDQHCSRAISNDRSHFLTFKDINVSVDGISGPGKAIGKGTIQWYIEDDDGAIHEFQIPNSFYVPSSPKCLLPSQHFAKLGLNTNLETTRCIQYHNRPVLHWGPDGEFTKTVYNNPVTDVPDMKSAPSNRSYTAYAAIASKVTQVEKFELACFPTVVSDDEESATSDDPGSA